MSNLIKYNHKVKLYLDVEPTKKEKEGILFTK